MTSRHGALAYAVLLLVAPGCIGGPPQGPEWIKFERAAWQPGYHWTYQSGPDLITVEVLKEVFDGGPAYLMMWEAGDHTDANESRLITIDKYALGRHSLWADPLEIHCYSTCNIRYAGQKPTRGPDLVPRTAWVATHWSQITNGMQPEWEFDGMKGGFLTSKTFMRGPLQWESPTLGPIDVYEFSYDFTVTGPDAQFERFAAEQAKQGIEVLTFHALAKWGVAQQNFVQVSVPENNLPAEVFHAGFVFDGAEAPAREYLLSSYALDATEPWSDEAIRMHWGT